MYLIFSIILLKKKKKKKYILVLKNESIKINIIYSIYIIKLSFCIRKIDINIQKIVKFYLNMF